MDGTRNAHDVLGWDRTLDPDDEQLPASVHSAARPTRPASRNR